MLDSAKRGKRVITYLIGLLLILNQFFIYAPVKAYAEEPDTVPAVSAETTDTKGASDSTVLAFTSDVHNKSGDVSANRLDTWITKIKNMYGGIDAMGFCGDMGDASASQSNFWTLTQTGMDIVSDQGVEGVYTTGNHEYSPGNFGSVSNDTTAEYKLNTETLTAAIIVFTASDQTARIRVTILVR